MRDAPSAVANAMSSGQPKAHNSSRWRFFLGADEWVSSQFKLYGAIRKCKWRHWWSAFSEFSITLIFALLPIWVPFIALPMFKPDPINVYQVLLNQIKHGELYIIAAALLAPIYYFTFPQSRSSSIELTRPFPSQQVLILIFIITICIAVLAIAATKVQASEVGIPSKMVAVSVALFAFCCVIFFLTLAVRNSLPETAEGSYDEQSRREQTEMPPPNFGEISAAAAQDPDALVSSVIKDHVVGTDEPQ